MNTDANEEDKPPTYRNIARGFTGTAAARERYDALDHRYHLARAHAQLEARGEYDPARHGAPAEPLTVAQHLERLALGEYLSRQYRPSYELDAALQAGATVAEVAAALDCEAREAREAVRLWADGSHRLHARIGIGLDDDQYAAALTRSADPEMEA